MSNKQRKNNRAQISELMTWVIATIAIITLLIIFVYVSSVFAQKAKVMKVKNLEVDLGNKENLFEVKTSIAYSYASEGERFIIDNWRKEKEKRK